MSPTTTIFNTVSAQLIARRLGGDGRLSPKTGAYLYYSPERHLHCYHKLSGVYRICFHSSSPIAAELSFHASEASAVGEYTLALLQGTVNDDLLDFAESYVGLGVDNQRVFGYTWTKAAQEDWAKNYKQ